MRKTFSVPKSDPQSPFSVLHKAAWPNVQSNPPKEHKLDSLQRKELREQKPACEAERWRVCAGKGNGAEPSETCDQLGCLEPDLHAHWQSRITPGGQQRRGSRTAVSRKSTGFQTPGRLSRALDCSSKHAARDGASVSSQGYEIDPGNTSSLDGGGGHLHCSPHKERC